MVIRPLYWEPMTYSAALAGPSTNSQLTTHHRLRNANWFNVLRPVLIPVGWYASIHWKTSHLGPIVSFRSETADEGEPEKSENHPPLRKSGSMQSYPED